MKIVGIDIWEPVLAIARSNVAASDHGERIELRAGAVERLEERAMYALAWFPGTFISSETTGEALQRIHHALIPVWEPVLAIARSNVAGDAGRLRHKHIAFDVGAEFRLHQGRTNRNLHLPARTRDMCLPFLTAPNWATGDGWCKRRAWPTILIPNLHQRLATRDAVLRDWCVWLLKVLRSA